MTEQVPAFSVVVPTYARPERLARCLDALATLDYPRDNYEVVVTDDGSPAPLDEVAASFQGRLDLTMLRQVNAGPAAARNASAGAAKHEYLAFTDDDCMPRPGWLKGFAAGFAQEPRALLGGQTENALADNIYARTSQQLVDYLYDYYGAASGGAPFFTSNNMAVPRADFMALGGFDRSFPLAAGEDREFGLRWRDRIGPIRFVPDAVVDHAHALTLVRFWRQHANYGRGARHLSRVLRAGGRAQHKVEPHRFYTGLVTRPLTESRSLAGLFGASLMLLSQVAVTWGYAQERTAENVRTRWR